MERIKDGDEVFSQVVLHLPVVVSPHSLLIDGVAGLGDLLDGPDVHDVTEHLIGSLMGAVQSGSVLLGHAQSGDVVGDGVDVWGEVEALSESLNSGMCCDIVGVFCW